MPKPESTPCSSTAYPVGYFFNVSSHFFQSLICFIILLNEQQPLQIFLHDPPPAFHRNLYQKFCFFLLNIPFLGILHPPHHFHPSRGSHKDKVECFRGKNRLNFYSLNPFLVSFIFTFIQHLQSTCYLSSSGYTDNRLVQRTLVRYL